jgi:hypothetical protein
MVIQLAAVLAEENNFGDTRSGSLAGPTGLVVILLLALGTFLLIRNMNSRLKRLPDTFEAAAPKTAESTVEQPEEK